jgi:hypothetical protein
MTVLELQAERNTGAVVNDQFNRFSEVYLP